MTEATRKAMHSSDKQDWGTPQDFFNILNEEFHFTLDPCADHENYKCEKYYTEQQDGLKQDWEGETVFCNPPYADSKKWIEKCYSESKKNNTTVVMLIPSRTDTIAFHSWIYGKAEIRFLKGRLRFEGAKNTAPFPSMIVVYRSDNDKIKRHYPRVIELHKTDGKEE